MIREQNGRENAQTNRLMKVSKIMEYESSVWNMFAYSSLKEMKIKPNRGRQNT